MEGLQTGSCRLTLFCSALVELYPGAISIVLEKVHAQEITFMHLLKDCVDWSLAYKEETSFVNVPEIVCPPSC